MKKKTSIEYKEELHNKLLDLTILIQECEDLCYNIISEHTQGSDNWTSWFVEDMIGLAYILNVFYSSIRKKFIE